jgi:hypothetical protein
MEHDNDNRKNQNSYSDTIPEFNIAEEIIKREKYFARLEFFKCFVICVTVIIALWIISFTVLEFSRQCKGEHKWVKTTSDSCVHSLCKPR